MFDEATAARKLDVDTLRIQMFDRESVLLADRP